jgi:hypothetical protein
MGKVIATQCISLDGVIEDPVGMGNSGLDSWTGPYAQAVPRCHRLSGVTNTPRSLARRR